MAEGPNLVRRQVYLTRSLNQELKNWSARSRKSESAIIRDALAEYLAQEKRRHTPPGQNPVLGAAGILTGTPDCRDVSLHHHEILAESMLKEDE